jgi:hypothetical protein
MGDLSSATLQPVLFREPTQLTSAALTPCLIFNTVAPALRDAALARLKHLTLEWEFAWNDGEDWSALVAAPWFQQLETLELPIHAGDEQPWGALAAAPALPTGLRRLRVALPRGRDAHRAAASWIRSCERLESLALSMPPTLDSAAPGEWEVTMPATLRSLTLDLPNLNHNRATLSILRAGWFKQLDTFTLQRSSLIGEELDDALTNLAQARSLTLKEISTEQGWEQLVSGLDHTRAEALHLISCDVDLSILDALADTKRWAGLRALTFADSRGGAQRFMGKPWAPRLPHGMETLCLRGCELSSAQLNDLLHSPAAATLRSLSLVRCGLEDACLEALADALPSMKRLERLDLSGNHYIKEAGLKHLLACPTLSQLSALRLHRTYLGVRARSALLNAPHIQLCAKADMFTPQDLR